MTLFPSTMILFPVAPDTTRIESVPEIVPVLVIVLLSPSICIAGLSAPALVAEIVPELLTVAVESR